MRPVLPSAQEAELNSAKTGSDRDDDVIIDERTVSKYKRNYNIPADAPVTDEMVRHHWTLERSLTKDLLDSRPENRWDVWEASYSKLYRECPWLNELAVPRYRSDEVAYGHFLRLIGNEKTIYEIGSGEAGLVTFLALHGYKCVATEVTRERGTRATEGQAKFEWHTCDGVHLDQFEPENHYDIVLSTQVIEHLHPADLPRHLLGVRTILRPGGRYIFNTPHNFFGPADLSAVFGKQAPVCMHLKEYLYGELATLLAEQGFTNIKGIYLFPLSLSGSGSLVFQSRIYLWYIRAVEYFLLFAKQRLGIKLPKLLLRLLLFTGDVFLSAEKPATKTRR